jgi:hypothetical protein
MADDPSCLTGHCRPSAQVSTKAGAFQRVVPAPVRLTDLTIRIAPFRG